MSSFGQFVLNAQRSLPTGVIALALTVLAFAPGAHAADSARPSSAHKPGEVRLAMLSHAWGRTARCFSTQFLTLLSYETTINAAPTFDDVPLDSPELFTYPMAIMSGEGSFTLSAAERSNLRSYLESGGLLLASAGCSNVPWLRSMEKEIETILPAAELSHIRRDHEIFNLVFEVGDLVTTRGGEGEIMGIEVNGRLALIYSPHGLNDTDSAGGDCCCCGANEIRQAKFINANILAYALLR